MQKQVIKFISGPPGKCEHLDGPPEGRRSPSPSRSLRTFDEIQVNERLPHSVVTLTVTNPSKVRVRVLFVRKYSSFFSL